MTHALKPDRMALLEQACRERGLPVTTQRRTVFEAILTREDHPTADDVCAQVRLRLPTISRATVYRILDHFVALGLITKICHPGSAARFDPKVHQHHHLVCLRCERIMDVEAERLNNVPWPDVRGRGFEIVDYHIHFRGLCADCRKAAATSARAPKRNPTTTISAARRKRTISCSPKSRRKRK